MGEARCIRGLRLGDRSAQHHCQRRYEEPKTNRFHKLLTPETGSFPEPGLFAYTYKNTVPAEKW